MNLRLTLCFPALLALATPAAAEMCKYVDRDGNLHYSSLEPEKGWRKLWCGVAPGAGDGGGATTFGVGPPSILQQCMDTRAPVFGVGPSARARECTRLYCARPEYQARIEAYAMRRPQNEKSQAEALTCITRAEQDRAGK